MPPQDRKLESRAAQTAVGRARQRGEVFGRKINDAIRGDQATLSDIGSIKWIHSIAIPASEPHIANMTKTARMAMELRVDEEELIAYEAETVFAFANSLLDAVEQLAISKMGKEEILKRIKTPFTAIRNLAFSHVEVLGQMLFQAEFGAPVSFDDFARVGHSVSEVLPGLASQRKNTIFNDQMIGQVIAPIATHLKKISDQIELGSQVHFTQNEEDLDRLLDRGEAYAKIVELLTEEYFSTHPEDKRNSDFVSTLVTESMFNYRVHWDLTDITIQSICRKLTTHGHVDTADKIILKAVLSRLIDINKLNERYLIGAGLEEKTAGDRLEYYARRHRDYLHNWRYQDDPLKSMPPDVTHTVQVVETANVSTIDHRSLGRAGEFALRHLVSESGGRSRVHMLYSINYSRDRTSVRLLPLEFRKQAARIALSGFDYNQTTLSSIDFYHYTNDVTRKIETYLNRANAIGQQTWRACGSERVELTPRQMPVMVGVRAGDLRRIINEPAFMKYMFRKLLSQTPKLLLLIQGPRYGSATAAYNEAKEAAKGDLKAATMLRTRLHPDNVQPFYVALFREGEIKAVPVETGDGKYFRQ